MSKTNMGVFVTFNKEPHSNQNFPESLTARLGTYATVFEPPQRKDPQEFMRLMQRNLYYCIVENGGLNKKTSGFRIVVASELLSLCEQMAKLAHQPSKELISTLESAEKRKEESEFQLYEREISGGSINGDRLYVRIVLKQNNL